MNLEKELKGSVKISVCGLNTERFINICHNNNILLNNVITTDSGCIMNFRQRFQENQKASSHMPRQDPDNAKRRFAFCYTQIP